MLRAYKYRLTPTPEQFQKIMAQFDATRFIYNWALGKKIEHYKEHSEHEDKKKRSLSDFTLIKMLPELKSEKDFLEHAAAQPLQQTIINLGRAYGAFFKKQNRFPRFKSYKDSTNYRFQYPQGVKVNFKEKTIFLPKIGNVLCVFHRKFEGKIKTCTVSKSASDKIYISVLVDDGRVVPLAEQIVEGRAIGAHMDIRNLVTTSDGGVIENPRFLDKKIGRIKKKNAQLSRLRKKFEKENPDSKGQSKKMMKVKRELALTHENVAERREDFLHKVSHGIAYNDNNHGTIIVEDAVSNKKLKNRNISRAVADSSWAFLKNMMQYKTQENAKNMIRINEKYSGNLSRICDCGYELPQPQAISITWECPECYSVNNKKSQIAKNLKKLFFAKGVDIQKK